MNRQLMPILIFLCLWDFGIMNGLVKEDPKKECFYINYCYLDIIIIILIEKLECLFKLSYFLLCEYVHLLFFFI